MGDKVKAPKAQKPKDAEPVKKEKKSTGSKVSMIIGIVLCVILVPVLIMNTTLIIKDLVSDDKKPPDLFGVSPLIVVSPSMYPLFDEGDMIFVKQVNPDDIKVGDVICFLDPAQEGEVVLTHRVLKIETDETGARVARTAGDFNINMKYDTSSKEDKLKFSKMPDNVDSDYFYWTMDDEDIYDDAPVPLNDATIIGVYNYVVFPNVGHVSTFMAKPYGWIICISVPLLAFVLYEVISRKKKDKSKQNDMDALLAELEALKAEKLASESQTTSEPEADTSAEVADATETADPHENAEANENADATEETENKAESSEGNT